MPGFGYAPNAPQTGNPCTVDVGVPVSLAMLQSVRLVSFLSPGVVWEVGCAGERATRVNYFTSIGVGVQQIGGRALDFHVGAQKIFRSATGFQVGLSLTYVRLP